VLFWDSCATPLPVVFDMPGQDGKGAPAHEIVPASVAATMAVGAFSDTGDTPGGDWLHDSRHMVLARGGSLWLADSERHTVARLTNGTTAASFPSAGPNDRVIFTENVRDHDIVEVPFDGGTLAPRIASTRYDGSAAWAPSGDRFAYVVDRGIGDEIRVRERAGAADRRLISAREFPEAQSGIRALQYSPDGRWLAFVGITFAPELRAAVWVISAEGGTPRRVTPRESMVFRSAWSPDGRAMAINIMDGTRVSLALVDLDSTGPPRALRLPEGVQVRQTEWSPTGEWIASFAARANSDSRPTLLVNPATGAMRELPAVGSPALAWSRDGKQLYGLVPGKDGTELVAQDIVTGQVRTVASYRTWIPAWELIGNTLRFSIHPSGRSLLTTTFTNRSNVWSMTGLQWSRPWLTRW
jgi:Tol biopolymer transport system component